MHVGLKGANCLWAKQNLVLAEVDFNLQNTAKHPSLNVLAKFNDCRLKPKLVANAQDTIVLDARGNGFLHIKEGEAYPESLQAIHRRSRCP
jgi:hypothetical protein